MLEGCRHLEAALLLIRQSIHGSEHAAVAADLQREIMQLLKVGRPERGCVQFSLMARRCWVYAWLLTACSRGGKHTMAPPAPRRRHLHLQPPLTVRADSYFRQAKL
jgi:hypothetical protein